MQNKEIVTQAMRRLLNEVTRRKGWGEGVRVHDSEKPLTFGDLENLLLNAIYNDYEDEESGEKS